MNEAPALRTARLDLTPLSVADAEDVRALFGDPGVRRIYGEGRTTDAVVEAWLAFSQRQAEHGLPGFWALRCDDVFVGMCGLLHQIVDGIAETEIGYLLRDAARGNGYATEAARFARDYAFGALDRARVVSIIAPHNVESRRVAERNGLTLEKTTMWKEREVVVYALARAQASPG